MVCASALFLSVCMSLSPSPIPSNCDSACLSVSVRYTSVRLDNRPSELHAEMTPHQHPILRLVSTRSPFRVAAPAPDFRRSWRAGSPRGRLPSAPLPGGRDPSPLTSPAPPPGADISGGPAEQRVLASGFLRALPTHCLQTLKLGTQQPQDPGPVPQSSRRTDAAMPAPWLLLVLAWTLTLTDVPGGRAQPEVAQQEEAMAAEHPGLDDLLRQAQRLLFLREDLQRLRGDQRDREFESQIFQPAWLSKRQHPGKREEEAEEGLEEEEGEGGAVEPHKRQHPGRREDTAVWSDDVPQQKRQHPGRRSSWLGYTFTKRQHPGRRLVDPKAQRSWEEEEEGEEEEELMPEKRQHPGKRALGGPCGLQGGCGQASLLLGLLDDLSRSQGAEEKRQHPGRRAAWATEPLEE